MLRRGSRRQGHHLFSAGRADLILMQIATSHLSNLATVTELGDKVDNSAALYGTVPDLSIPRRNSRCAIPYFDTDKNKKLSKSEKPNSRLFACACVSLASVGLLQLQTMTRRCRRASLFWTNAGVGGRSLTCTHQDGRQSRPRQLHDSIVNRATSCDHEHPGDSQSGFVVSWFHMSTGVAPPTCLDSSQHCPRACSYSVPMSAQYEPCVPSRQFVASADHFAAQAVRNQSLKRALR
jgi:hypothetical protein